MEELLHRLLTIALRNKATDIHLSLENDERLLVEMRVDGKLRKLRSQDYDASFFRYLMFRSNLDLSLARKPQTGSFETEINGESLALRFAIITGWHMTCGVLRILNQTGKLRISDLSCQTETIDWLSSITHARSGLFVFSGPTGSGKTTTVYTLLNQVRGKKIYTLEDPVEVYSDRYVQMAVNEKAGFTFASGIRQLLRHDPDIIMIGEIRDEEAAAMAVRCALTGHLVITTLHSFSCTGAIQRLKDLGVSNEQMEDVLFGISCQRLYTNPASHRRFSIYEHMNRKEVKHYFEYGKPSSAFISLESAITSAMEAGLLTRQQAEEDLLGL